MQYRHGDPHPTKPGWKFFCYRRAKGKVSELWASPEAWAKRKAARVGEAARYYRKNKAKLDKGTAKWREKNREKVKAKLAEYRKDNSLRCLYGIKRATCKKKGIPFELPFEFFLKIPSVCPVLGIPIKRNKRLADDSPSIDRRDGKLGYVPGNVTWMSNRANRIKSNATPEELQAIAAFVSNKNNYQI